MASLIAVDLLSLDALDSVIGVIQRLNQGHLDELALAQGELGANLVEVVRKLDGELGANVLDLRNLEAVDIPATLGKVIDQLVELVGNVPALDDLVLVGQAR